MNNIHPKAYEFANRYGFSIDEETGTLELSGGNDTAVILDVRKMFPDFVTPLEIPYVRSLSPNETIVFFCESSTSYPDVPIAQYQNEIAVEGWDWSNANCPEPYNGCRPILVEMRRYIKDMFEAIQELEQQREQEEEKSKKRAANLAALPERIRSFIEVGSTHGLTYDAWDTIDGPYRFVRVKHLEPSDQCAEEPRPTNLPWIEMPSCIYVLLPQDFSPVGLKPLKGETFVGCSHAVWPKKLATGSDALEAFEDFIAEREAYHLRKPDFFSVDLYDVDQDEAYLVDGLLPETGISLVVGDWDSGKTILLVDLAAHIAYGLPWLKRTVAPCPVIYYALEAGDDVSKRLSAANAKLDRGKNAPLGEGTVPVRVEYEIPEEYDNWNKEVQYLSHEIRERLEIRCRDHDIPFPNDYPEVGGAVIIVDTLRQACGHKSRGPEVEEFFAKVDRLVKDGVASHVIIAHHTTKFGDNYSGDDFLVSDSTSLFYVRRPSREKQLFRLVCDRVKGISKPPSMGLLFKVVNIGMKQTVVLTGEANADPKLLAIAESWPSRIPVDDLRNALEPHLTGKTDAARYKSFQRQRDKFLESGLLVPDGDAYVRSV